MTISSNTKNVSKGAAVTLTGQLTRPDTGAAIAGAPVDLYARPSGGTTWSLVGTTTSGATGSLSLVDTPDTSTEYQWVYAGSSAYTGTDSSLRTVQVRTK